MSLKQLVAHIKHDGLKQRILNKFDDKTKPKKLLAYVNNWRRLVVSLRIIASVLSLGIAPFAYFIWAKHQNKKDTNWITKPLSDTKIAVMIIKGACDQEKDSHEEDEESAQSNRDIKHSIPPHDPKQNKATLVTIFREKTTEYQNSLSEKDSSEEPEFDQRKNATILGDGKICLTKTSKDEVRKTHRQYVIYNDENTCEKICFTDNESQEKFPLISTDIVFFSVTKGNVLIHDGLGKLIMKIQNTNIPDNVRLIPINLHFKDEYFYVIVATENMGLITLHQFSNNDKFNSSTILFEEPLIDITALTYNPSQSIIYIIDSDHRIHSIKTNSNRPHSPLLEGRLEDLPDSTQINKLAVSYKGHFLYAADIDGNIYQYQTDDFKTFKKLNSQSDIEGEILDLKCVDDPKYVDPKKMKLLIVSTQQIYSKSLSDLSEVFTETQASEEKSQSKPKKKPLRFEISLDNKSIKLQKNSSKLPVILITDRENDAIIVKHYNPSTGYIYAGTQQGFLHIAQIDPKNESIIVTDEDKKIKKLGNGPITMIEPVKITDGQKSYDLLLIRLEAGLATLYHADNITHVFDASCDVESTVFFDENQNLIARNASHQTEDILCNKADLLHIINIDTFSPGLARTLAKSRTDLHAKISATQHTSASDKDSKMKI